MLIYCEACGFGTEVDPTYAGEKYCDICGVALGFVDTEERYVPYWEPDEIEEPLAPKPKEREK